MPDTDTQWNTDSWPTTVAKFDRLFPKPRPQTMPAGVTGKNFVTPDHLGIVKDSGGELVEVTTGWMPGFGAAPGQRVFGLTWARVGTPGATTPDDRDQLCHTWAEVQAALGLPVVVR